jgi:hypothetical protein
MRIGVYPGTFNPPTIAHLAVAEAAWVQRRLDRVMLVVSTRPIDKEHVNRPTLAHRLDVLHAIADASDGRLGVAVTDKRLLVDIADGYDVLIMGADKWAQVNDPGYYDDDPAARDRAVAALPELAIARRAPFTVPRAHELDIDLEHEPISSTGARQGIRDWMSREAADFDDRTGAWTDSERYERWLLDGP